VEEDLRRMSAFWHTVFGGIISAVILYYFARRASKELRTEADGLRRETEDVRHYVDALISYLEAAGASRCATRRRTASLTKRRARSPRVG
jgi:hypothetical protein